MLVLIEFILCIVLKCENSEELLQCFVTLPEASAEDMQGLIEGANIQVSEAATSFAEDVSQASFMNDVNLKTNMAKQLDDSEMRRRQLEIKMLEMEEESQAQKAKLAEKDEQIKKMQKQIKSMEVGIQDESNLAA